MQDGLAESAHGIYEPVVFAKRGYTLDSIKYFIAEELGD